MLTFQVSNEEWKIAKEQLTNADDGTKLSYSYYYNAQHNLVPRKKDKQQPKPYRILRSFIKINGQIYAIARSKIDDPKIPHGSMAITKYAQTEDGQLCVMKISAYDVNSIREAHILQDLSLSYGCNRRIDRPNLHYTIMPYLGVTIDQLCTQPQSKLSNTKRMRIAIELCWQMYRLHQGLASHTNTAYAHRDLKPDNFVIDNNTKAHLIDFGLAEKKSKKGCVIKTGARLWTPCIPPNQSLTDVQCDMVALKRVLFMPTDVYTSSGFIKDVSETTRKKSVLTKYLLEKYDLDHYINTHAIEGHYPDYSKDFIPAVTLCAILITAKLNLPISNREVRDDIEMALAITALYFQQNIQEIPKVLKDKKAMRLLAALNVADKVAELEVYRADAKFLAAIEGAADYKVVHQLIRLKALGLDAYYEKVNQSDLLSKAISLLGKNNLDQYAASLLQAENQDFAKTIIWLKEHHALNAKWMQKLSPQLMQVFLSIQSVSIKKALTILMSKDEFHLDEIIAVCQNAKLAEAILALEKDMGSFIVDVKGLIASNEKLKAILLALQMDFVYLSLSQMIKNEIGCQAFNLINEYGAVSNKINLVSIFYNPEIAELIVNLHQLRLDALYDAVLNDSFMAYQIIKIINSDLKKYVNLEMLSDDNIRQTLFYLAMNSEQVRGFSVLCDAGLMSKQVIGLLKDDLYILKALTLLYEHNLKHHLEILVNYPKIALAIVHLLNDGAAVAGSVLEILKVIPSEKYFPFLSDILKPEQFKLLWGYQREWQQIKNYIKDPDQKQLLEELVLTEENRIAKHTIKNIKITIKNTAWERGLFSNNLNKRLGKTDLRVPECVAKQIDVCNEVSRHEKSYAEGVYELKSIAKAGQNYGKVAQGRHLLFGKSVSESYLEKFENEEVFKCNFTNHK